MDKIKDQLRKINKTSNDDDWRNKIKFQYKSVKLDEFEMFDMYCRSQTGEKRRSYDSILESVKARKKRKLNGIEFDGLYGNRNETNYDFGPYCVCRLGFDEDNDDMIQCSDTDCQEWFHTICMDLIDSKLNNDDDWYCSNCSKKNC